MTLESCFENTLHYLLCQPYWIMSKLCQHYNVSSHTPVCSYTEHFTSLGYMITPSFTNRHK